MLKNFLKIAYRNLFKYKYYSLINIIGFSIGIAAFIYANIYTNNEQSYDSFHSKSNRIYRIINVYEKDSTLNKYAASAFPLAKALSIEFPGYIEECARLFNFQNNSHLVEYHTKHFNEKNFFYADPNIVKIFDFQFIAGNSDSALHHANTVIISQKIKEKYFGEFNPIGKMITIDEGMPMEVTGVFKDFPEQSHIHIDILTNFSSLYSFFKEPDTWLWNPCWTYVLIKDKVNPENLEKRFPGFVKKIIDPAIKDYSSIYLQAITDIHLNSDLESEIEQNNKVLYINIILIISFFLLIVSWLNFINLSFVGSITRLREISIRKILGSTKIAILLQFIVESILAGILAFLLALFLIEIFIPGFNIFSHEDLQIKELIKNKLFVKMLIATLVSGLIVGFYTGFYSSLFPTFNIGRFKQKLTSKKWFAGKILIMMQYIISLIILIIVFVNFKQLLYFKNTNLGFDKENILVLPITNTPVSDNLDEFKSTILKIPNVRFVSSANNIIGTERSNRRYFYEVNGNKKTQFFPDLIVDHDFIKTLGIKVLAGTDFKTKSVDNFEIEQGELIINESMVRQLDFKSNKSALNKSLITFKGNEKIVGIIQDFSSRSLHSPLSPLIIRRSLKGNSEDMKYLLIKINSEKSNKTIASIEKIWKSYSINRPFEYQYLDSILDFQYKNEDVLNYLLWIFSVLTIIISCLGIWAVTSLLSIQRTKEIGIRKALGASISEILILFIKDFVNLLIIANLIAWPVAWLVLNQWFKNFANHIQINWTDFVISSLIILFLTLAIVIKHALKVANSNSIDSLRDE